MMRRSSYRIIIAVACCGLLVAVGLWHEAHTLQCMRGAVEQALEMNRNFVPFTSDSTMRRVVTYFDHPLRFWVSANDRLRAHYALGCVYRDMHEAPLAIIEWEEAVACADTTEKTACVAGNLVAGDGDVLEDALLHGVVVGIEGGDGEFRQHVLFGVRQGESPPLPSLESS